MPYEGQSFSALRRQCQHKGTLFEDPLFPTSDQSLFYQRNQIGRVTWKRPNVSENNVLPRGEVVVLHNYSDTYCIHVENNNDDDR